MTRESRVHDTLEDAVRAVLRRGNTPIVKGSAMRRSRHTPESLSLALGAYVREDTHPATVAAGCKRYIVRPGD